VIFITYGCGARYTVGSGSAFYTVEKAVFDVVDEYLQDQVCNFTTLPEPTPSTAELYPNPSNGMVSINGTESTSGVIIQRVTGAIVHKSDGPSCRIMLVPGIYIVTGYDHLKNTTFRKKLIIQQN